MIQQLKIQLAELTDHRFTADVHLGKLARMLRLLGFDVLYDNKYKQADLVSMATAENRILLSRNKAFIKHTTPLFYYVSSEDFKVQLTNTIQHFNLSKTFRPFTRCLQCNGLLTAVAKEKIVSFIPVNTTLYYNRFWQCGSCKKVYWKGPHYQRMQQFIQTVL